MILVFCLRLITLESNGLPLTEQNRNKNLNPIKKPKFECYKIISLVSIGLCSKDSKLLKLAYCMPFFYFAVQLIRRISLRVCVNMKNNSILTVSMAMLAHLYGNSGMPL